MIRELIVFSLYSTQQLLIFFNHRFDSVSSPAGTKCFWGRFQPHITICGYRITSAAQIRNNFEKEKRYYLRSFAVTQSST